MKQGLDNGDGGGTAQNGVLESGEVDYTTTYCSSYEIRQVADIYGGGYNSNPGSYMEILVGDTLYFSAYDGSSNVELWAHDTSTSSTWQVADIYSGAGGSNPGYSMALLVGDTIYFSANDGNSGAELWGA
jgi:ELWxxDGT repeat protein